MSRCSLRHHPQRGFTLVELSIVLVIIGLIIGGVLTGQQVIQNARITNTVNAIHAYQAQFQTYVQNYSALPGDDANAPNRFNFSTLGSITASGVGDSSGHIDGVFDTKDGTQEPRLAWLDLRAAGLVKNQADPTAQPFNPFGGYYGFQDGAFGGQLAGTVLCLSNVPGTAALSIDSRLDDGNSATGSILAKKTATGTSPNDASGSPDSAYDSTQTYTLCVKQ